MDARSELDVVLRALQPADAAGLLDLHVRNRQYWRATGPRRDDAWFTIEVQRRLEDVARDRADDRGLAFGISAAG